MSGWLIYRHRPLEWATLGKQQVWVCKIVERTEGPWWLSRVFTCMFRINGKADRETVRNMADHAYDVCLTQP